MPYGVVWRYETPESGKVIRLVSSPESLEGVENEDVAKKEGRAVLAELVPEHKTCIKPLSVVEINDRVLGILKSCPIVKLPAVVDDGEEDTELEFVRIDHTDLWAGETWWHH